MVSLLHVACFELLGALVAGGQLGMGAIGHFAEIAEEIVGVLLAVELVDGLDEGGCGFAGHSAASTDSITSM